MKGLFAFLLKNIQQDLILVKLYLLSFGFQHFLKQTYDSWFSDTTLLFVGACGVPPDHKHS